MTRSDFARLVDHTLLRSNATEAEIRQLCTEAAENGFAAVSVNPVWASYCAKQLSETLVKVDACVGFPLGANSAPMKVEEAKEAVRNGAGEIDMVINLGALKSGYHSFVEREISAVVRAVPNIPVKVIFETCFLTRDEKILLCEMCLRARAAFVKTSTGFGDGGATVEDVQLMRDAVGTAAGVKAAGGIRTCQDALSMLQAGASRIGTSSALQILAEYDV